MKRKLFTFLMAFLATLSGAVWGQDAQTTLTISSTNPTVTVTSADVTITQEGSEQIENAKISFGGTDITEYNVTINALNLKDNGNIGSGENPGRVMDIPNDVTVNLTVIGENNFYSEKAAAIFLPNNSTLTITKESTGSLTVDGFRGIGNGEGSGGDESLGGCGTITIKGGTLIAQGHDDGNGNEGTSIGGSLAEASGKLNIETNTFVVLKNIDITELDDFNPTNCVIQMPDNKENEATVYGSVTLGSYIPQEYSLVLSNESSTLTLGQNVFITKDRLATKEGAGAISWDGKLNAYQLTLEKGEQMNAEERGTEHNVTIPDKFQVNDVEGQSLNETYFGAESRITIGAASCTQSHQFIGWYRQEDNGTTTDVFLPTDNTTKSTTFTAPMGTPSGIQSATYSPIWAESNHEIFVVSGTSWDNNEDSPEIIIVPDEVTSKLTFELSGITDYGVSLSQNKLTGTPTLKSTDNGLAILHNVKVIIKNGEDTQIGEVTLDPFIISETASLKIYDVNTTNVDHIYNGTSHNDIRGAYESRHLLTLKAKQEDYDGDFTALYEQVHYRIKSYTYKAIGTEGEGTKTEATGDKETLLITKAGTYSNIVLEALTGTFVDGTDHISDAGTTEKTLTGSITVAQKELSLVATEKGTSVSYTVGSTEPTWSKYAKIDGIVNGDEVSGTIPTPTIVDGTDAWKKTPGTYNVTFNPSSMTTLTGDDAGNYKMGTNPLQLTLTVKGDADNVDIQPGTDSEWNMLNDGTFSHVYDGKKPNIGTIIITVAEDVTETLTENEDFTVDYDNVGVDVKEGGYTATITFEENDYITTGDTKEVSLNISARPLNISFKDKVASIDGLTVADLVVADNLVNGKTPKYSGTINADVVSGKNNVYHITIEGFKMEDSDTFKSTNYATKVNGKDYNVDGENIDLGEVTEDDDNDPNHGHGGNTPGGDGKIDYYNMYVDTAATCDGVELSFSKNVVREGNQVSVYVDKILEGYNADDMKLWFKRSLYGYWEELEEGVQPGEYIIYNVYTDIYVKATDVEKNPTGIEEIEGVKVYAQDGSLYVYTPKQMPIWIVSMTGAIVHHEEQIGLHQYDHLNQGIYIVRVGEQVFKIRL